MNAQELKIKCFCKEELILHSGHYKYFDFRCENNKCNKCNVRIVQGSFLHSLPTDIDEIHILPNFTKDKMEISGFYYKHNLCYENIPDSFFCIDKEALIKLIKLDFNQIKQKYHNLLLFK